MKYRKLRIAWSVAWGALAVFVMVMLPPRNPFPDFGGGLDVPFRQDGFHWPTCEQLMAGAWGPVWPLIFKHALGSLLISPVLAALPWVPDRSSLRPTLTMMRQYKLRTAWSVAWSILAMALCVVWYRDWPRYASGHFPGVAVFDTWSRLQQSPWDDTVSARVEFGWTAVANAEWQVNGARDFIGAPPKWFWLQMFPGGAGFWFHARHWFLLSLLAGFATVPWSFPVLPKRFSLRTLLIVMTLIAVALPLFMWAAR